MAAVAQSLALNIARDQIASNPGSPYFLVSATIRCGGKVLTPAKMVGFEIGQDFTSQFADSLYLTVEMGIGDVMYDVAPYAEDIRIMLMMVPQDEKFNVLPGNLFKRTYTAYIASEIPSPNAFGGNPTLRTREMANHHGFVQVVFKLEETSLVQFKRMSYGTSFEDTIPGNVPLMFIHHSMKRLVLSDSEAFSGIDVMAFDNNTERSNIVIPDGTKLMDIPDLIQNKEGGIYNAGLAFYLTGKYIYLWSLYNTKRNQTANRILRCYIAPDVSSGETERTWSQEGRRLDIWCKSNVIRQDNAVGTMNLEGTGVRYTNTELLMNGFAEVGDGKLSVKKGLNVNEFSMLDIVNQQQNVVWGERATSNTFHETSIMAKRRVTPFQVTWDHSNPTLLTPNMSVEIIYVRGGVASKIMAAFLGAATVITTVADGFQNRGSVAQTVLVFGVDQADPLYSDWVESGAIGVTSTPQIL